MRRLAALAVTLTVITVTIGASASLTVASKKLTTATVSFPPKPTDVIIANTPGGTPGKAEVDDTVTITFSKRLAVASLCPGGWSGDSSNQSLNVNNQVVVTIEDNTASGGNDKLLVSVTSGCTGGFRFGEIDLGNDGFVPADRTFSGSGANRSEIDWTVALRKVVITLGGPSGGPRGTVGSAVTAVYTPHAAITDTFGIAVFQTASRNAVQF